MEIKQAVDLKVDVPCAEINDYAFIPINFLLLTKNII